MFQNPLMFLPRKGNLSGEFQFKTSHYINFPIRVGERERALREKRLSKSITIYKSIFVN
jgi:hypothetical protein